MSEENDNKGFDFPQHDTSMGMAPDGKTLIITIPIHKYANDERDGNALIYGKLREIQANVLQVAKGIRDRRAQLGIAKPTNGAVPTNIKLH